MLTMPLLAFRINLHYLARRIQRGETIRITKNGKPIADAVPPGRSTRKGSVPAVKK
jgi:antitoxin (DNA-binding transcriptional repressor) of toxin-antitoxin stability system